MVCAFFLFGALVATVGFIYLVLLGGREVVRTAKANPEQTRAFVDYIVAPAVPSAEVKPEEEKLDDSPPKVKPVKGRLV